MLAAPYCRVASTGTGDSTLKFNRRAFRCSGVLGSTVCHAMQHLPGLRHCLGEMPCFMRHAAKPASEVGPCKSTALEQFNFDKHQPHVLALVWRTLSVPLPTHH